MHPRPKCHVPNSQVATLAREAVAPHRGADSVDRETECYFREPKAGYKERHSATVIQGRQTQGWQRNIDRFQDVGWPRRRRLGCLVRRLVVALPYGATALGPHITRRWRRKFRVLEGDLTTRL